MARNRRKPPVGPCTIPPAIPDTALPDLILQRNLDAEAAIRRYVESQSQRDGDNVTHAERITTEYALGQKYEAWDVRTAQGRWWVITSPTNLYSQELFPSLDYTISFHIGLMARVMARSHSKPGVERMEEILLAAAWRKWEQAAEALDEAEEPEDFQAVGMRCRESLIAMVRTLSKPQMVSAGAEAPKRSDVPGWVALIANHVAHGQSAKDVRAHMKGTAKSIWDLVNWLTHASSATRADAILGLEATRYTLGRRTCCWATSSTPCVGCCRTCMRRDVRYEASIPPTTPEWTACSRTIRPGSSHWRRSGSSSTPKITETPSLRRFETQ